MITKVHDKELGRERAGAFRRWGSKVRAVFRVSETLKPEDPRISSAFLYVRMNGMDRVGHHSVAHRVPSRSTLSARPAASAPPVRARARTPQRPASAQNETR
eukprot:1187347-Prorocentrum_minimum.AAC.2